MQNIQKTPLGFFFVDDGMNVQEAIEKRRAFRSLETVEITNEIVEAFASAAQLSASCFNNQPWRFVFVYEPTQLTRMHEALSQGNEWAYNASMILAVLSKKEYDCVIRDRLYYQFDTGMATAFLILRATEMGFVAHPIAGFSPKKTREILGIPDDIEVITLVIIGKHAQKLNPVLSDKQKKDEMTRPQRKPLESFVFHNRYQG